MLIVGGLLVPVLARYHGSLPLRRTLQGRRLANRLEHSGGLVPTAHGWTSLEIVKLVVGTLTPLAVLVLGIFVNRISRRVEATQWANQSVITRRLEIFTEIAPKLNQLYCFATFVGRWKETRPEQAVALKRDLDETMYSNRILFSDELFIAYRGFASTLFLEFAKTHGDAPLRVPVSSLLGDRRTLSWWNESSQNFFAESNLPSREEIERAYRKLGERLRTDLYVMHTEQPFFGVRSE
jgi:hypothetical protein